jgi:hypothetical protein
VLRIIGSIRNLCFYFNNHAGSITRRLGSRSVRADARLLATCLNWDNGILKFMMNHAAGSVSEAKNQQCR